MDSLVEDPNVRRVLDAVGEGVLVINRDRRIVYLNEKARRILGYEEGEVLEARCKHITQTSECESSCPLTRAIGEDRDQRGVDMWYRTKNGHRIYCRTNVVLLRDAGGEVVGGVEVFSDISRILHMREGVDEKFVFDEMIGRNRAVQEVFDLIRMVAETDSTVLVTGESGTGKELVANAIHRHSARRGGPFVKVNCAALNEGVLESELFGHVKGAFTGAVADKVGRFELAGGGTLFLDEIGDLPPTTQVKLLRVLQEGEFERVGSSRTLKTDARVVTATNRDLSESLRRGQFRQDLYYRLNVFHIPLPPLRDRKEDIPLLVDHFLKKVAAKMPSRQIEGIEAEALTRLMNYPFPGNIRELENVIEHASIRCQGGILRTVDLPLAAAGAADPSAPPLVPLHHIRTSGEPLGRDLIQKTLEGAGWRIQRTAERLGVSRVTLWRKMKEYGLQKPDAP